jgi:hypothetical protein
MDKMIALLNIDHYRKMLATEHDETKRQTVLRLLAEEQAKLAAPDHPPNKESMRFVSGGQTNAASGSAARRSASWFPR